MNYSSKFGWIENALEDEFNIRKSLWSRGQNIGNPDLVSLAHSGLAGSFRRQNA